MFTTMLLVVWCLSMINQISIVISSISIYAETEINSHTILFMPNKEVVQETQEQSPGVQLIAVDNNTTNKNNIVNETRIDTNKTISGQYIITLKAEVTRTSKGLQDALDNLTAKVQSEGAKVMYVYKYSTKGLAIKVPNQQILEKLLNDLRKDSSVAAIEPDKTVQAF
jgi:Peptidase inhibitor I9